MLDLQYLPCVGMSFGGKSSSGRDLGAELLQNSFRSSGRDGSLDCLTVDGEERHSERGTWRRVERLSEGCDVLFR